MKTTLREQLARYERIGNVSTRKREREKESVHLCEREMEEVRVTPRDEYSFYIKHT